MMQLKRLRSPFVYIPLSLALLFILCLVVLFNPSFQKSMLLKYADQHVDSLTFDTIHITPWSLSIVNLDTELEQTHIQLQQGEIRFCLTDLVFKKINVKAIRLQELFVDVENQQAKAEPAEQKTGFPGILNSINFGYGYVLGDVLINAQIKLPEQQQLFLDMHGGEIEPKSAGKLFTRIKFETGNNDDHVVVNNELSLDQISHGKFNKIVALLDIQAFLTDLPVDEKINLQASVVPIETFKYIKEGDREIQVEAQNDEIDLSLSLNDEGGELRSLLDLQAIYNTVTENISGGYQFKANEKLLQPYLQQQKLPPSQQTIQGDFSYLLANNTGDLTVLGELQLDRLQNAVNNQKVPDLLKINNNFSISMLPDNELKISVLKAGVTDIDENDSLLARSPEDMVVPLNNIDSFLAQDNTLLEIEIPQIPLIWFDFLVPEYEITGGYFSTAFQILTKSDSSIHVQALKPLTVDSLSVRQSGTSLAENIDISITPNASYHNAKLGLSLSDFSLTANKKSIMAGDIQTSIILGDDSNKSVSLAADAKVNTRNTLALVDSEANYPADIPASFSTQIKSSLNLGRETVNINALNIDVNGANKDSLISIGLLKAIGLNTTDNSLAIPSGSVARLSLSDINLSWLAAFIPDLDAAGVIQQAVFNLSGDDQRNATLSATRPLKINNISIYQNDEALINDVDFQVLPVIDFSDSDFTLQYHDLLLQSDNKNLIAGNGKLKISLATSDQLDTSGELMFDLQAISQQAVVADVLQGKFTSALTLDVDYALTVNADSIQISKLESNLNYADSRPRLTLSADSEITLSTSSSDENSANFAAASGAVSLTFTKLDSEPFKQILTAKNIDFKEVNGQFKINSNGRTITLDTLAPLEVSGVELANNEGALLNPFSIVTSLAGVVDQDSMQFNIEDCTMAIDQQASVDMLKADINVGMVNAENNQYVLQQLQAKIEANLPILFSQPAVLPNHKLKTGAAKIEFSLLPNQNLKSLILVDNLVGSKKLSLQKATIDLAGRWQKDGGFSMTGPISTQGRTGESHINTELIASAWNIQNRQLAMNLDSQAFYLNDILNTLSAISDARTSTENKVEEGENNHAEIIVDELVADQQAFWDTLPYESDISLKIDELYYTDYLVINTIGGNIRLTPEEMSVNKFSASFHDSPLKVNSIMTFTPGPLPYNLDFNAGITQFDLTTFLTELVPDAKPRAEGLFDISLVANGQSPNIAQYRNNLLFDMRLQSKDGLFRLLDPDSALIGGSTRVLGTLGEAISYVPTGLFGVGAVSRLVKYIKVIEYDVIDIHLLRDQSRNLVIEEYRVENPELLMTASGGVDYVEGQDVLESPLDMEAQLNFRGHGAAIMYDLNLLEDEKNAQGYWLGPKINFSGTMTESKSNLDEVVSTAGNAAILGGITRPISGLIGNIKYRWFGDDKDNEEEIKAEE